MTQRDRQTLVWLGLGLGGAFAAAFLVYQFFLGPLLAYNRRIAGLEDEVSLKNRQIQNVQKDRLLVENARRLSLPANPDRANAEYGKYLLPLLRGSGLSDIHVQAPPPVDVKALAAQQGKKAGHIILPYTVQAKGSFAALGSALEKLQRTPILHRVKNLTIDRTSETQSKDTKDPKLRIQMTIEAMIVSNLDKKHEPVFAPDTKAVLPSKEAPREYASLAGKNIFVGPVPPPPPEIVKKTETSPSADDGIDVREHVRLVSTDLTSQEAFLRNFIFQEREKRLRTNPKSGYATFKIMTEEGRDVVKGRVMRIDQRDVYFQVGEDIYGIHIGQTLADAMRRPLSEQELEKLELVDLVETEPVQKSKEPPGKSEKNGKETR